MTTVLFFLRRKVAPIEDLILQAKGCFPLEPHFCSNLESWLFQG